MKKLISLQLEDCLLERIKNYCKSHGSTLSGIIRLAIIKYLEENNG